MLKLSFGLQTKVNTQKLDIEEQQLAQLSNLANYKSKSALTRNQYNKSHLVMALCGLLVKRSKLC